MKISQRKAGVIISYMGQLVHILTGFIYTPIMLRLLGQSEYGLYQLVNSVVSYLSLLSLGFGASYMRFYSREKAAGNKKAVAKVNGMFMLIFCTISVICLLCGIVMVGNIHSIFGNGLTESEYQTARVLMLLLIINMALTFPNSIFNCIVTSQERFLFQKSLILAQYILNPFLTLPLLLLGFGSVGMVSVTTVLTVGVLLLNIYYCFHKLHAEFCFKGLRFSTLKEMWVFTFFIFLNQIIDQINLNVDKFLLGRLTGTVSVALYGVGSQLNTLYMQLSSAVSNVFVPRVNTIVANHEGNDKLSYIFIKVGRIQFMIMALVLSGFVFYGKYFISIWAGEGYDQSYWVALFLMLPVTVPLIQNIGIEIQRAKNMHQIRSVVYFLIAVCNVGISIPLIKLYGPVGATVGTAIALLLGNIIFMNWFYYKKIELDIPLFWKNIFTLTLSMIPAFIVGILTSTVLKCTSIIRLLIYIVIYSIVYGLSVYRFGMHSEEKQLIDKPIKKLVHRK